MLFITFVENAFKYGVSSEKDCTDRIGIRLREGVLEFRTENAVMRHREEKAPGIGIENCRKRLQLLYPERFELQTSGTAEGSIASGSPFNSKRHETDPLHSHRRRTDGPVGHRTVLPQEGRDGGGELQRTAHRVGSDPSHPSRSGLPRHPG